MKKLLVPLVVIVAILLTVLFFLTRQSAHTSRVAELLPADTVAFLHLPDLSRTRERWPKTALAQIFAEPEVQAFLEKPLSVLPHRASLPNRLTQIAQVDPREAFLAVASIAENNVPKAVAGFSYGGKKEDARALLNDLRSAVQNTWPAGKSDLVEVNGQEIETFSVGQVTAAAALKEDWFFLSDDLDLLKSTLERFDGKSANSLRDNADFKTAIAHMPIDFDALNFVQPQAIADRLISFSLAVNPNGDPHQFDELKKVRGFVATTKLEGADIRDTMFTLRPGLQKKEALAEHGLALTAEKTLLYYAARLQKPENFQMPNQEALNALGFSRFIQPILDAVQAQGLTSDDFWSAFGPEVSLLMDWPATAQIPAPLLALDVHDKAKVQRFVDAVTQTSTGAEWAHQILDGVPFYQLPQSGFAIIQIAPTLAVTDRFVVFGLSTDSVKGTLAQLKSSDGKLDKNAAFQKIVSAVHPANTAFGFVDSRPLFERIYGPLRPFAMMWAAFLKGSADYVDVTKLPTTETISKHLGPIVFSQSIIDDGAMSESLGPVTSTQALVATGVVAGAVAIPYIQKQFSHVTAPNLSAPAPAPIASRPAPSPSAATSPAEPQTTP